jgi:hypothetical protein
VLVLARHALGPEAPESSVPSALAPEKHVLEDLALGGFAVQALAPEQVARERRVLERTVPEQYE